MDSEPLSCPAGLIAQTMGLMTSYAAGGYAPGGCTGCQQAIVQAIIERLYLLGQHPQLAVPMQLSMRQAHGHWVALLQAMNQPEPEAPRPWVH